MAPGELNPDILATLRALAAARVEFIVIGTAADVLHEGRGGYVDALAIVPSGFARNIERLSRVLTELEAELRVRGESQTLPVDASPAGLRALGRCTLATELADVTVDFEPPGTAGYPDLYAEARRLSLPAGVAPQVASPEDLDRIEAATRSAAPRALPTASPALARGRAPVRSR